MNSDQRLEVARIRASVVRSLIFYTLVAIAFVMFLGARHTELTKACNGVRVTPQVALEACDFLLKWTAKEPSTRSLLYRHKMRAYMFVEDWDSALREVDLAIAEDPESFIPWSWKASVLLRAGAYDDAMKAKLVSLNLQPYDPEELRDQFALLFRLKRHNMLDAFVAQRIREGDPLDWLGPEELDSIRQNRNLFPKTFAEISG